MTHQLNSLNIIRSTWGNDVGQLRGTIGFGSPYGEIQLILDDKLSQDIVKLCAEALTRVSKSIANDITADIISTVALPAPKDS